MRNKRPSPNQQKAVVLLSGGIDSSTTLYLAKKQGYKVSCLIFDYGQRHKRELDSAKRIAQKARCKYHVLKISLPWRGSALLDRRIEIPHRKRILEDTIPLTYVPARNTIFLSFALSFAEAINASIIFIGANAIDFSGYPDCRPDYIKEFNRLSRLATKRGQEGYIIKIKTPLINKTKAQIIKLGKSLGVPYELTWSCYRGGNSPCGECDSCHFRAKGFKEAGVIDPLIKKITDI